MFEETRKPKNINLTSVTQRHEKATYFDAQKKRPVDGLFTIVDNRQKAVTQRKQLENISNSSRFGNTFQSSIQAPNQHTIFHSGISKSHAIQAKKNSTGLPDRLKSGIESLSGYSMDDVKVHYHSNKPKQLQAHAYAQGTDIHLASGQEEHLPHEAWHVVQQKQGRVSPTTQLKDKVNVNDDAGLEKEADVMGAKAMQVSSPEKSPLAAPIHHPVIQRTINVGNEEEVNADEAMSMLADYIGDSFESSELMYDILVELSRYDTSFPDIKKLCAEIIIRAGFSAQLTEDFTSKSGDRIRGIYNQTAHGQESTSLQARDAEVSMLQKVDNWFRKRQPVLSLFTHKAVFIRISKGPCNSCRDLIKLFRKRNPGVRVIIEYRQKLPRVKEEVGKDRGQNALSYGFSDAAELSSGIHYKIFPSEDVPLPAKVSGYKQNTLVGLRQRYLEKFGDDISEVEGFIGQLGKNFLTKESDRELLKTWLTESLEYRRSHSLTPTEQEVLKATKTPSGGTSVVATGKVVMKV